MIQVPEYVEHLVEAGVEVTISKNDKLGLYFDLNLQSKSHMYLHQVGDDWFVSMRYDEKYQIEDWNDLMYAAKKGMHGRDFIHHKWAELLIKEGYLTKVVETTVTYK